MSAPGLGSIFEPDDGAPRGPDLHFRAQIGPPAPGPSTLPIRVPRRLEADDGLVYDRAAHPSDDGDTLTVHIPDGGALPLTLRLRGQGGVSEGRAPGDLLLTLTVDPSLPPPTSSALTRVERPAPPVVWAVGAGLLVTLAAFLAC